MNNRHAWGNLLLRLLLGFMFTFVGASKLFMGKMPVEPIGAILDALGLNTFSAATFGLILGIIELVIGLMFILGLFTQVAAWIATVALLLFVIGAGLILGDGLLGQMMMFKDIGLIGASLCLAFQGSPSMSLDHLLWKK